MNGYYMIYVFSGGKTGVYTKTSMSAGYTNVRSDIGFGKDYIHTLVII